MTPRKFYFKYLPMAYAFVSVHYMCFLWSRRLLNLIYRNRFAQQPGNLIDRSDLEMTDHCCSKIRTN